MEETDAGESEKLTEEEKRQKVMLLNIVTHLVNW